MIEALELCCICLDLCSLHYAVHVIRPMPSSMLDNACMLCMLDRCLLIRNFKVHDATCHGSNKPLHYS